MQCLLLKILIARIEKYNPKADLQKYRDFMNKTNENTSYFWFIDNEPTKYDIEMSEQNKKFAQRFGEKKPDDVTMYYEDPIQRLKYFKL